jgi:hypothetical protein
MIRPQWNIIVRASGAVLFGLLLITLVGCGAPPVVLSGVITDAYTGAPVNQATVTIGRTKLTTDPEGRYTTPRWNPADTMTVIASGYEIATVPLKTQEHLANTEVSTVTLETALRPNTLSGVVTDRYSSEPLAGAVVSITTGATNTLTMTTSADGRYQFDAVSEQVTLEVSLPDYETLQETLERTINHDIALRSNVITGIVSDRYTEQPLGGVEVTAGTVTTQTAADGAYRLAGVPADVTMLDINIDGYAPLAQQFEPGVRVVDAVLRPDVLTATLVDQVSGEPVANATVIATTTLPGADVAFVRIDNSRSGRFTLDGIPEQGYLQVLAPGYRKAIVEIKPGSVPEEVTLEPFDAKALYVKTSTAAYQPERMQEFFDVIDRTELNAMVIDLKSDNLEDLGLIYYESQVPIIQELGTSKDLMDIRAILAEAKKRDVYTIARIHIFAHDNLLAQTRPDWAAQDTRTGKEFYADWNIAWLDPWNRNVWDYNIQLGIEAAQLGFDEIQFDYIRFPNDASDIEYMRLSKPHDPKVDAPEMYQNIATFIEEAHRAMNGAGAFFSADVFGYATWAPQAQIGQNLELMAAHADYICPMVYPSHYYTHELGFDNAAAYPYEIVYESLKHGAELIGGKRAKLRPWLQDFTLIWVPNDQIVRYGPREVRAQIKAAEDFGASGWALWSADNEYTYDALKAEE